MDLTSQGCATLAPITVLHIALRINCPEIALLENVSTHIMWLSKLPWIGAQMQAIAKGE